jgi:ABC-2 type transport system ATP-binding protein
MRLPAATAIMGNMSEPVVRIEGLSYSYGTRRALDQVDLSIEDGEIFGFLGPNGSGKTTLFRILSTLVRPQTGRVTMLGADLATRQDVLRPQLAVVFQSPSLDVQLTARENLRHHGHLYGLGGRPLEDGIERMLAQFSLSDRGNDYVRTLSGGMRRRVELAKGLLTRPRILLMDEPATGLDPAARVDLWRAIQDARRSSGLTVLVTTHLMDEAEECDRLAIMDGGRVVVSGAPGRLKEQIGGDVITLRGRDAEALRRAIEEKFGLKAEMMDGTVRLERPRAHEFVPQLVEAMPGLIESISVGRPTLEDVFIHATGHRLEA